ncbi:MAG TPA: hypothetical protein DCF33_01600 [Saprospirales bacterium]|nr:hypothetical protein [Saprospirales bacterium]
MVNIKIYIEGGGEGKDLDSRFREGWTKFFKSAGLEGKMPRPVRGKGRDNTFDLFCTAIKHAGPNDLPLLLVDSEDPVHQNHNIWDHLSARDKWSKPDNADENHAFLMVQLMETWFLADTRILKSYFGNNFNENKVPKWTNLESVEKSKVLNVLNKASNGKYEKGKISFELLGRLNVEIVKAKLPNAKRLLDYLQEL